MFSETHLTPPPAIPNVTYYKFVRRSGWDCYIDLPATLPAYLDRNVLEESTKKIASVFAEDNKSRMMFMFGTLFAGLFCATQVFEGSYQRKMKEAMSTLESKLGVRVRFIIHMRSTSGPNGVGALEDDAYLAIAHGEEAWSQLQQVPSEIDKIPKGCCCCRPDTSNHVI
mmetsp:Transcript_38534/g.46575  ORF Transcript_38534/g.46575 Transcript_38534/m.46575 type:complete len:169 (-) Transcript_38534:542-1048(-)|eukprot:CAMPEP_0197853496 /NCGR_PEP_ID=MMETSP1438-20131217/22853_1 /TAXON_ID=1461541 /ORGANISM="Pterosperma sp., Strain CCMP1384" /LENGTH=168 /DNA_ID=CAMNT_0043467929 /DNA_START=250 /DNA_END=756 /DNA_ORIENTATION=-